MTKAEIGRQYSWNGLAVRLRHLDEDGRAMVQLDGSDVLLPAEASDLALVSSASDLLKPVMQVPEVIWKRACGLAEGFRRVVDLASGRTQAMKELAAQFQLSSRRIYQLFDAYKENPCPWACIPRKAGRKKDSRVLDVSKEKVIETRIEEHYLRREKPSIASLHDEIEIECEKLNLPVPAMNTVRNRVEKQELAERIRRREGRKRSAEICEAAAGHIEVHRALQRVEVDHTLCDVQLVADTDRREVLGRPWITLAIDCFTRMILGFYVSFDHPSSKSVAFCLAHAFLPKEEWMRKLGIPGEWPTFGFPEQIYVDNAMEFRALALRRGCEQFGITLCYRPPGEPQVGGTIERLIGTMMGRLHLLPGTTHSNVIAKGDYDSEACAQLTTREFIEWLSLEVVTRYHTKTHRSLGHPPIEAWREATAESSRTPPGAPLEVLTAFLPAVTRVLRRTGIERHRLSYWSPTFAPWIGHDKKVLVHDHPWDPTQIYVRLPNGELAVASNTRIDRALNRLTLTDLTLRGAAGRKLEKKSELVALRHEGHGRKKNILDTAAQATRRSRRSARDVPEDSVAVDGSSILPYRPPAVKSLTVYVFD